MTELTTDQYDVILDACNPEFSLTQKKEYHTLSWAFMLRLLQDGELRHAKEDTSKSESCAARVQSVEAASESRNRRG